ncbi:unnamed protein product [Closterium sp. NIES-53]
MDYSLLLGVHFKATRPPPAPIVTITDSHLDGPTPASLQPAAPHGSSATAVTNVPAEREQGPVGQAGAAGRQSEERDGEETQQPQQGERGEQAACESDASAASRRLNAPPPLHQLRRRLFRPWQRILTDSPSPLQRSLVDPGRGGTTSSHTSPSHTSTSHASSSQTSPSHTSPSPAGATAAPLAASAGSPASAASTRGAATARHLFPRSLTAGSSPLHLLAPSLPHSDSLTTDGSSVDDASVEGSSCGVVEGEGRAGCHEELLGPADDRAAGAGGKDGCTPTPASASAFPSPPLSSAPSPCAVGAGARATTGTGGKNAGATGVVVGQASPGEKTDGRGGGAVAAAAGGGGGGGGGRGRGVVGQLLGQGMGGTAVRVDRRTRRAVKDPLLGEAYEVLLHFGIIDILQVWCSAVQVGGLVHVRGVVWCGYL